jgi:sugar O-acyltransferase (sialic acid O-acetyltransferase NeuD family)
VVKKLAIIGAGGFGREAYYHALAAIRTYGSQREIRFFADDKYADGDVLPLSKFDPMTFDAVIAIGNPSARQRIAESMSALTTFATIKNPSSEVMNSRIGDGSIICSGVVITDNVSIGRHVHINLNATIGHDCIICDYVTIAPGANISGNVTIGQRCNIGTNAAIREKVTICDDVVIGMGCVVLQDITEAGTYVGIPAKLLTHGKPSRQTT